MKNKTVSSSRPSKSSKPEIEIPKVPVTISFLALAVASQMDGKPINHPASTYLPTAFVSSIHRLVGMLAEKYSHTCQEEVEDLAQQCMLKIVRTVYRNRNNMDKFSTTWVWNICTSVLNSRYRKNIKRRERLTYVEDIENNPSIDGDAPPSNSVLASEIADTVRELAVKHPKYKKLVFAMFGNPNRAGYIMPTKVKISEASRNSDIPYSSAANFYKETVQPLFLRRFAFKSELPLRFGRSA